MIVVHNGKKRIFLKSLNYQDSVVTNFYQANKNTLVVVDDRLVANERVNFVFTNIRTSVLNAMLDCYRSQVAKTIVFDDYYRHKQVTGVLTNLSYTGGDGRDANGNERWTLSLELASVAKITIKDFDPVIYRDFIIISI